MRARSVRWLGAIVGLGILCSGAAADTPAKLAIVIDDIGYNEVRGMRTVRLPGPMTLAVLPFAPHTRALIPHALGADKDIIIHQPMEPHPSPSVRQEVGTLTLAMSAHEFDDALSKALAAVPESIGLSNHTGSLLTAHHAPMTRVMRTLGHRNMFFLDSRTTAETVALDVARKLGVRAVRRDVFLDHTPTSAAIHAAFEKSLSVARRKGHAVLVGHPYPVTLKYLEQRLADLPNDIVLVGAKELAWAQHSASLAATGPVTLVPGPHPASLRISLGQ